MEKVGKIRKVETPSTLCSNYWEIQEEIEKLSNKIKLLQLGIPCIKWKETEEMELVNVSIDKEMLEISKTGEDCYIGKGYKLVETGNKRQYLPIYFKEKEVLEIKVIQ